MPKISHFNSILKKIVHSLVYSKIEKYVDTLENNNPPSLAGFEIVLLKHNLSLLYIPRLSVDVQVIIGFTIYEF